MCGRGECRYTSGGDWEPWSRLAHLQLSVFLPRLLTNMVPTVTVSERLTLLRLPGWPPRGCPAALPGYLVWLPCLATLSCCLDPPCLLAVSEALFDGPWVPADI